VKNGVVRPLSCISCRTISGELQPPGGIIYNDVTLGRLPAGNVPTTLLTVWYGVMNRLKLRQAYPDDEVARVANMLREGFSQLAR
jgi:hypothetical protein